MNCKVLGVDVNGDLSKISVKDLETLRSIEAGKKSTRRQIQVRAETSTVVLKQIYLQNDC